MTDATLMNSEILVNSEWLYNHLDDPNLRIIDCDLLDSYERSHIKGAVGISVHHYIKHPSYPKDPKNFPWVADAETVKEIFEDMGIGDDTTVVTYDSGGSLWASRFWWVLNYYGHTNAKVLDGGWKKWFDEGKPISIDPPKKIPSTFTPNTDDKLICTLDQALSKIDDPKSIFLDVRSDGEWNGSNSRGNAKSGRIPGSIHIEWTNFVTADKYQIFKSHDELRRILEESGVTPDKEIIPY
ncbi:MAG: hypothetical protein CL735_04280 [Chloroflexi bacterium]|nr:hypothetical protein [Chloroflexota bacterium]|tara:strand:- start:8149 stop:8868 length:720 start_codon:yes stop_codon:yes gene_type:complete